MEKDQIKRRRMTELWQADWIFEVRATKKSIASEHIVKDVLTPKLDDFGAIMEFNQGYPYECAIRYISTTTMKTLTDSKVEGYKKVKNIKFTKKIGHKIERKG